MKRIGNINQEMKRVEMLVGKKTWVHAVQRKVFGDPLTVKHVTYVYVSVMYSVAGRKILSTGGTSLNQHAISKRLLKLSTKSMAVE